MVHTYHFIPVALEKVNSVLEDLQFDIRSGQGGLVEFTHGFFKPWYMGIVEDRQSVRSQFECLLQCRFEAFECLVGQSVDEVDVNGVDAVLACQVDRCLCQVIGLDTVDLLLDLRIEILYSERDTVEAMLPEDLHLLFVEESRVDLTAYLRIVTPVGEGLLDIRDDLVQFKGLVEGRCPPAKVELYHFSVRVKMLCQDVDLFFEILDVLAQLLLLGGKDNVAAAEIAGRTAERQVNVQREFVRTLIQIFQVFVIGKVIVELQCCRIRGVSRPRFGVFAEFFEIYLAHLFSCFFVGCCLPTARCLNCCAKLVLWGHSTLHCTGYISGADPAIP